MSSIVFDVEIIRRYSLIQRSPGAHNGRPEYKLAHDAYDTERQDHLPSARTQPKPRCRPGTLDSPQQVVREKEET